MRILAYMPIRNEAARYLDACLTWLRPIVDDVMVYDDGSDDTSAGIALHHDCKVVHRPDTVPSFLSHEGRFRHAAWEAFEYACEPRAGDWILAIDADEFIVADIDERDALEMSAHSADTENKASVLLPVPEVFSSVTASTGKVRHLEVRTDGAWGRIQGTRYFRYRPGGSFRVKRMGCGAEPTYAAESFVPALGGAKLLHLGYAQRADRSAKYDRYTALAEHGHADAHIQSIMATPRLAPWQGKTPPIWRGVLRGMR